MPGNRFYCTVKFQTQKSLQTPVVEAEQQYARLNKWIETAWCYEIRMKMHPILYLFQLLSTSLPHEDRELKKLLATTPTTRKLRKQVVCHFKRDEEFDSYRFIGSHILVSLLGQKKPDLAQRDVIETNHNFSKFSLQLSCPTIVIEGEVQLMFRLLVS